MSLKQFDFIEEFINLVSSDTDAPIEFIRAAAFYLISAMLGRNVVLPISSDISYFKPDSSGRLINMWFIIWGKSRIARKSTVMNRVKQFIEEINGDWFLTDTFSPEKLVDEMQTKPRAAWINDECSIFFDNLSKKGYMSGAETILSTLYDGRSYSAGTISRGKTLVKDPYLTMFLASTDYLYYSFGERELQQGFFNRYIFVHGKKTRHKEIKMNIPSHTILKANDLLDWLKELYKQAETAGFVQLPLSSPARKIYNEFERKTEKRIMSTDMGIKESYFGNLPNFVLRLSAIYRLSRIEKDEIENTFSKVAVKIDEEDVEKAINYSAKVWEWFEIVINKVITSAKKGGVWTDEGHLSRALNFIKNNPNIKKSDLMRKLGLRKDNFVKYIETLLLQNDIEEVKVQTINKKSGKRSEVVGFIAKSDMPTTQPLDDIFKIKKT